MSGHDFARWRGVEFLSEEQLRVLSLLQMHGAHATSFQILESGYTYWFDSVVDAVLAYVEMGGTRVVAGPPVAALSDRVGVTRRFVEECKQSGKKAIFVSVGDAFLSSFEEAGIEVDKLPIGLQPEWDPRVYRVDTPKHKTLRSQVRRAQRKGVVVRMVGEDEVAQDKGQLLGEIAWVVEQWKQSRKMSPMQFMVALQPFHLPEERRYFVATQERRAVGVLIAVPVYGRDGWFFEDVLRVPDAPNGTVECLIDFAFQAMQTEESEYATLGLCPLVEIPTASGKHHWKRKVLHWCYAHLGPLYQFKGLYSFKKRFVPHRWAPQYVATVGHGMGLLELFAVWRVLLGDEIAAFVWDSLRRMLRRIPHLWWSRLFVLLGALLVPWTVLLSLADGVQWFGDASIHLAWVVFDVCLAFALFLLAVLVAQKRPAAYPMGLFVGGTTLTDFVLTSVQVFYLHQHATGWALLFVVMGVCGPLIATCVLVAFGLHRDRKVVSD